MIEMTQAWPLPSSGALTRELLRCWADPVGTQGSGVVPSLNIPKPSPLSQRLAHERTMQAGDC